MGRQSKASQPPMLLPPPPPLLPVVLLLLALLLLPSPTSATAQRAAVGFHDGLETSIRPFTIYSAAALTDSSTKGKFTKTTFTPSKNYALDRATGDIASPVDIASSPPIRQSRTLQCPLEKDAVNEEARDYDSRAREAVRKGKPLHFQSKWRYFTLKEWVYYVQCMTAHFAATFKPGQQVFDSGGGAGAFVKALDAVHPGMEFYGSDLSATQVDFANDHVYDRAFCMANSRNIHWVRTQFPRGFDHVISNGVIHLACRDSEESYEFVQLLLDLTKPGGYVWLGTLNDQDKRDDSSNENCYDWNGGSSATYQNFYRKKWWVENLDAWGAAEVQIVDESDSCRALYDGDRCRYTVLLRKKEGSVMPPARAKRDDMLTAHIWKQEQLRKVDRVLEIVERQERDIRRMANLVLGGVALVLLLLGIAVVKKQRSNGGGIGAFPNMMCPAGSTSPNGKGHAS